MLPSSRIICDALIKASQSNQPLPNLQDVMLNILVSVYPEKYTPSKALEISNVEKPENISHTLPFGTNLVVMLSGGLGSTASLWKTISSGRDCKMLFVEGVYSKTLENVKKKFLRELATDARGNNGQPLADGSVEQGFQSWLDSLVAPKTAHLLCRKAKIILLSVMAYEKFNSPEMPLGLVWGSTFDCSNVYRALKPWNVQHIIPFSNHDTALFALSHGEIVTETLKEKHGVTSRTISPGPMLSLQCLNHVCSCWDNRLDTTQIYEPRTVPMNKPFSAMCTKCDGCKRWYCAANVLYDRIPNIRFGTREVSGEDDDRHWKNIPTLKVGPRRIHVPLDEPKKTLKKTKGRPKKSKLESKQESDTEEEDGVVDGEEKDDVDDETVESEEDSDSEEEYLCDLEDEEDIQNDDVEELPEELLSDFEDDGGGYDSDAGKKKRKRKKKY